MLRAVIASLICLLPSPVAVQENHDCLRVDPAAIRVKDGDTVAIEGSQFAIGGTHVSLGEMALRLDGIVAPEPGGRDACETERIRGRLAAARLAALISAADDVEICLTTRRSFERFVGALRVDGQRLGEALISEGLARSSAAVGNWCERGNG